MTQTQKPVVVPPPVMPATTDSPLDSPKPDVTKSPNFRMGVAPASLARDDELVARLTTMINEAFARADGDMWIQPPPLRTDEASVRRCIEQDQMALAWTSTPTSPTPTPASLCGCITLIWEHGGPEGDEWAPVLGHLACDNSLLGMGIGRALIRFAEEEAKRRGANVARIELLVPVGKTHPSKKRLAGWYERLGYDALRTGPVAEHLPALIPFMPGPMEMVFYEKML